MEEVVTFEIYQKLEVVLKDKPEDLIKLNDLLELMKVTMMKVKEAQYYNLSKKINAELEKSKEISEERISCLQTELSQLQIYNEEKKNLELQKDQLVKHFKPQLESIEYVATITRVTYENQGAIEFEELNVISNGKITPEGKKSFKIPKDQLVKHMKPKLEYLKSKYPNGIPPEEINSLELEIDQFVKNLKPELESLQHTATITSVTCENQEAIESTQHDIITFEGMSCFYRTIAKYFRYKDLIEACQKIKEKYPYVEIKPFGDDIDNGIIYEPKTKEIEDYMRELLDKDYLADSEIFDIFINQVDQLLRIDDSEAIQSSETQLIAFLDECSKEWDELLKKFESLRGKLQNQKEIVFFNDFLPRFRESCECIKELQKQIRELSIIEEKIQKADKTALEQEKKVLDQIKHMLRKLNYDLSASDIKNKMLNNLEALNAAEQLRIYLYALILNQEGETKKNSKSSRDQLLKKNGNRISEGIVYLKNFIEEGKTSSAQDEWILLEYLYLEKKSLVPSTKEHSTKESSKKTRQLKINKGDGDEYGYQNGGRKNTEIQSTITNLVFFEQLKDPSEIAVLKDFEDLVQKGLWIDEISKSDHENIGNSNLKGHRQRCKIEKTYERVIKIYLDNGKGTVRRGIYSYLKQKGVDFINVEFCGVITGHCSLYSTEANIYLTTGTEDSLK